MLPPPVAKMTAQWKSVGTVDRRTLIEFSAKDLRATLMKLTKASSATRAWKQRFLFTKWLTINSPHGHEI
jgi:hypothetical protein